MKRAKWKSRIGFIWAAVGSAVGLGNIWRFPYVVGDSGGGAFLIVYLLCLAAVGFPVLLSEISIGRATHSSPAGAYEKLGRNKGWRGCGVTTIFTGFMVSAFYGVVCGWTLGYLVEIFRGTVTSFGSGAEALAFFNTATSNPWWTIGYHALFMFFCLALLLTGVVKGIERGNKVMMPLLFVVLILLVIKGAMMPGAAKGISFLFKPDWSTINSKVILMALGQAFFALSLGQGTMVTYGSYIDKKENLPSTCFPIALFSTCVSFLAGIAIFAIVFSFDLPPGSGPGLMFQTLPLVFSQMSGGLILAFAFFTLLFLAGLTSEISAMEPLIAYFVDEKKWSRRKATSFTTIFSFLVGVPCSLAFGPWKGGAYLDTLTTLCVNFLIPFGGLLAVIVAGWRWGIKKSLGEIELGSGQLFERLGFLRGYFYIGIRYTAPILILLVFLNLMGIL